MVDKSEKKVSIMPQPEHDALLGQGKLEGNRKPSFRRLTSIRQDELYGKFTGPLVLAVAAATCGSSFIFGYNIGVMNAPDEVIKTWIQNVSYPSLHGGPLSNHQLTQIWSWIVGIYPLGGMFGGLACGWLADKCGRKGAMMLNNVFALAAALIMGIAKPTNCYPLLIVGRLIVGFNCGLNSGLAPMYLIEIAPINLSGMLGSVNQLMVTLAILTSNVLGLPYLLGTPKLWPLLLALTGAPAVFQLIALRFCPESPKYLLIVKHNENDADKALSKLRGKTDVSAEMTVLEEEAEAIARTDKLTFLDMFRTPLLAWSLTIAVVMMLAQQWSGINVAMYFSTTIFREGAKLSPSQAGAATLGMGALNVIMTLISTLIVDKAGRRVLMLVGLGLMWVCGMCIVITLHLLEVDKVTYRASAYFAIFFVYFFVVGFATGPGSIPWFYVSEIFDQSARGKANAVAVGVNWGANFIVGYTFLLWKNAVNEFSFLLYAGIVAFFWMFIFIFAPETKGKKLNDIKIELEKQAQSVIKFFRCGR